MTFPKFSKSFSKKTFFNVSTLLVAFSVLLIGVGGIFAQARINDNPTPTNFSCDTGTQAYCIGKIPRNSTRTYSIFFPYGSTLNTSDLYKAIAKITIDNPSMEFVNTDIYDFYNTGTTPAEIPECSTFTGTKYKITPSIVSANQILYGLQSANNATAASGGATTEKLLAKHTGCIQVTLKVATSATQDAVVKVSFDEDFGENGNGAVQSNLTDPYYPEANRPAIQIAQFTIGPNASSSSSSSSSSSISSSVQSSSSSSSVAPVATTTTRSGGATWLAVGSLFALGVIILIARSASKSRISEKKIK